MLSKKLRLSNIQKLTHVQLVFFILFTSPGIAQAAEELLSGDANIVYASAERTKTENTEAEDTGEWTTTYDSPEYDEAKSQTVRASTESYVENNEERRPTGTNVTARKDDASGAMIYSYPLEIPPGRNGLQPELSLNYNSQSKDNNNIFGYGWSMSIPSIERMNKTGIDQIFSENYFTSSLHGELSKLSGSGGFAASLVINQQDDEQKSTGQPTGVNKRYRDQLVNSRKAFVKGDGSVELYQPELIEGATRPNSIVHLLGFTKENQTIHQSTIFSGRNYYFDKKEGKYLEIDTRLMGGNGRWLMRHADYTAELPKISKGNIFTFEYDNLELSVAARDMEKPKISGDLINDPDNSFTNRRVTYKEMLGSGVDIDVRLGNEALRKDVVIHSLESAEKFKRGDFYEFSFRMIGSTPIDLISNGKKLSKEKTLITNETVQIIDEFNRSAYIWAPYAVDSANPKDATSIEIEYAYTNGWIDITKRISARWLESAIFPVRTDASISPFATSGDGDVRYYENTNWDTVHDASSGTDNTDTDTTFLALSKLLSSNYRIRRTFLAFDTSAIGSGSTISSSTLQLRYEPSGSSGAFSVHAVAGTQTSTSGLDNDDYNNIGATSFGSVGLDNTASEEYKAISMNASGLTNINKAGYTKIAVITDLDLSDTAPSTSNYHASFYASEETGTSKDPYLVVIYNGANLSPSAPTNLYVEDETAPANFSDNTPEFSAQYNDSDSGDEAGHYQIQVSASSTDWSTLKWDSGKTTTTPEIVAGSRSQDIAYAGSQLASGTTYYWRIKFWDDDDAEGLWSAGTDSFNPGVWYGAKVENGDFYTYEFVEGRYWKATDKRGTVFTFGQATSTRQYNSATTTQVARWMIEEIRDKNDNYIKYDYFADQGQLYPSTITYTGNGVTDGTFEVNFSRENRTDYASSTPLGIDMYTSKRISEIQIEVDNSVVRKYEFDYRAGDNATRSLLESIEIIGYDSSGESVKIPSTDFIYSTSTRTWTQDNNYVLDETFVNSEGGDIGVRLSDVNGDGLSDLLRFSGTSTMHVYINDGDGTGWTEDLNFTYPSYLFFVGDDEAEDNGVRLADINGDSLVDFIFGRTGTTTRVFINNRTGWVEDGNYLRGWFSKFVDGQGKDLGNRIVDINGDGVADIVKGEQITGEAIIEVAINTLDGYGWRLDTGWLTPETLIASNGDAGVRFADVNGDGLPDFLKGREMNKKVYLNVGSRKGWTYDTAYNLDPFIVDKEFGSIDAGARLADVTGDGQIDIVANANDGSQSNFLWVNDGDWTGFTSESAHVPDYITETNGKDNGVQIVDINGDGLEDILRGASSTKSVHIANGEVPDLLTNISEGRGAETKIVYKGLQEYRDGSNNLLNTTTPFVLQTVYQIVNNDGLGTYATTTFEYHGGYYYYADELDRKFAGFSKIVETDDLGNVTKTYFHQGNDTDSVKGEYSDHISKAGKPYRIEKYDTASNLYAKTINKWDRFDLEDDRNFVKLVRTVNSTFDGDSDSRSTAGEFEYSNTTGNLSQKIEYGLVTGNDNGTFTDLGTDTFTTNYDYAASTTLNLIGLPKIQTTIDNSSTTVQEIKLYYDELAYGSVSKGNETKRQILFTGSSSYIHSKKIYNSYGLPTSDIDFNANTTTISYDSKNLYPATVTNPLSQATTYTYDYSSGKVATTTDPNSRSFFAVYDGFDRPKQEWIPRLASPTNYDLKTAYAYLDGRATSSMQVTNYLTSATTTTAYAYLDGYGRTVQDRKSAESSNIYNVKDYVYDEKGRLQRESLPYSSTGTAKSTATTSDSVLIRYTYDAVDRPTQIVNIVGTTTNAYDDWNATTTDAAGNIKAMGRDAYGNLSQVNEVNATNTHQTLYEYNYLKNLTKITDANANVRNFTYDKVGRRLTAQDIHAVADVTFGTWTYTYDKNGNIASRLDPKSQTVNYTYDALNRPLTEDYTGSGGTEVQYAYDHCDNGKGRLCTATSTNAITRFEYNPWGLVKQETKVLNSTNYVTQFTYNRQGNVDEITYPDSYAVLYEYNAAGLLERLYKKTSGGAYTPLLYDQDYSPSNQVSHQEYFNSVVSDYTYDVEGLYRLERKTTDTTGSFHLSLFKKKPAFSLVLDDEPEIIPSQVETLVDEELQNNAESVLEPEAVSDPAEEVVIEEEVQNNIENTLEPEAIPSQPEVIFEEVQSISQLQSPLVNEIVELRTPHAQYQNMGTAPDGRSISKATYHLGRIHYLNNDTGKLERIDSSLSPSETGWSVNAAPYKTEITRSMGENFLTFGNKDQQLSFTLCSHQPVVSENTACSPVVQSVEGEVTDHQVVFQDAGRQGIDISVRTTNEAVNKEVIFESLESLGDVSGKEFYEVSFLISSNEPMELSTDEKLLSQEKTITTNNIARLVDSKGNESFIWPAIAKDSGNPHETVRVSLTYTLLKDGRILLTKKIPVAWLSQAVFPVRTDAILSVYSTSGDGDVRYYENPSWSTVHDSTTGTDVTYTDTQSLTMAKLISGNYRVRRYFLSFDTSSLGSDASITSAVIHLTYDGSSSSGNFNVHVASSSPASTSALATTDYNDVGQTSFGSVSTNSSEGEVAKSVTFNATGLSYISKTGYTHLSLRAADDINNSAPVSSNNHATFYTSEETGTTKDPYLDITYVSGTIDTSAGNVSQDYTYTYDQVGNITQIVDASDNHAAKTLAFTYDDLNRLTTASSTLAASSTNFLHEYDYNPIGNIEDKTGQGSYEYKGGESSSYANAHAATKIGSKTLAYDNNGNLTSDGTWNYAWDYNNRLTEAGSPTATSTFTYDHTGQRVSLDDGPNVTYYPSRLYNVEGATTTKHIYAGDTLVATVHGTDIYTVHTDHLGSPVLLVAENGGMIQLQDFFPYGELRLNHSNEVGYDEQRKYTGHEYDADTGLTYMGARYYPTQYGRILSQDPISLQTPEKFLDDPQQQNMYSYASNNPIFFIDPFGLYNQKTGEVEKGDTLSKITNIINKSYGTNYSVKQIASLNKISNQNLIHVGQTIKPNYSVPDITRSLNSVNQLHGTQAKNGSLETGFTKANSTASTKTIGSIGFANNFRKGGNWDLKSQDKDVEGGIFCQQRSCGGQRAESYIFNAGEIPGDAPGNIHYGFVGKEVGYGLGTLLFFGGVVQTLSHPGQFGDPASDKAFIRQGYGLNY